MYEPTTNNIAKELTIKAIESQLIRLKTDDATNAETVGKAVADLFNTIRREISKELRC